MMERIEQMSPANRLALLCFLLFWLGFGAFAAWFILASLTRDQMMVVVGIVGMMVMFVLAGVVFAIRDVITMKNNLALLNQDDMDEQMKMVKLMQLGAMVGNNRSMNIRLPQGNRGQQYPVNPTFLFPGQDNVQQPAQAYDDALSIE